ncbi:MAG: phosphoribosyltransferase, partial [Microcystis sp.]
PDYYVEYYPDNPWIHQPFERYELITPQDLLE